MNLPGAAVSGWPIEVKRGTDARPAAGGTSPASSVTEAMVPDAA